MDLAHDEFGARNFNFEVASQLYLLGCHQPCWLLPFSSTMLLGCLDLLVQEHQYEHLFQDPHKLGPASEWEQVLAYGPLLVQHLGQHVVRESHTS
ncbi:hypothetical protein DPMN_006264 [Dreissena polymorpha]|uniref:Uncharacterized protein n=1 Tax=Dreissena polymorpha TaxID=45954 RepID=A0A9D4RV84_DREPO|nr:hypothetical protein DPMN_006264 [Dreissena polymorpha]